MKKADKPRVLKEKRRLKITKIGNERGDITTNSTEMQRIIRNRYEQHISTNWNIEEMDKFLATNLLRLNHEKNRKSE